MANIFNGKNKELFFFYFELPAKASLKVKCQQNKTKLQLVNVERNFSFYPWAPLNTQ